MKLLPDNRLIAYGTIAGVLLSGLLALAGGIAWLAVMRSDVTALTSDVAAMRGKLDTAIGQLTEVRADVRWLRHGDAPAAGAKEDRRTARNEP